MKRRFMKLYMTREKATKIVTDFLSDMNLSDMNPDMWDGNGNKPESFDEMENKL